MRKIQFAVLLFLFMTGGRSAFSHPHVKLTSTIDYRFQGKTCIGCTVIWEFDRIFSTNIIHEFDRNGDGKFEADELKRIHEGAFVNLKDYGYFIYLRKGTVRKNPDRVSEFKAWQKDGILYYSFFISFDKFMFDSDFYIAVFDRSYYCATVYDKSPVHVSGGKITDVEYSVDSNKKYPVYYDPMGSPDDRTIYRKWRPGLETAYPEEIHLIVKE